ncbi:MAG TPA: DNA replication/repair protein RecF [Pseudomonadales bacterium]|nr:DNA replication/repair protein RecF [Pseudomonadales bacterium]
MTIRNLQISGVRNLESVHLQECGGVNIFTGANGSGKTSILEAIFILARARSFRSAKLSPVINHLATRCVVYGELGEQDGRGRSTVGVMRSRNEQQLFKINGNPVHAAAQLAELLPLQLINAESFSLLEGGPRIRRQFLDWGVFHVEPEFLFHWRRVQKALKHRNTLLRRGRMDDADLAPWDAELAACAEAIDVMRAAYLNRLRPHFLHLLEELVLLDTPELLYRRGWADGAGLAQALERDRQRDQQQGATHSGPQRADIDIRIGGKPAEDVLSRGQEKLLACALRLAQGVLLHELTGKTCIYLVDDLPAELDMERRQALCRQLTAMRSQVFVTATDPQSLQDCWPTTGQGTKWFHVEHGRVSAQ